MSVKSHVLGAYHFNLPKKVVATLSFFLLLDENPGKDPMSMTCQWHLETYLIEPSGGVQICLSIIRSLRMPTRVVGPEGSKMWTCRKPALGRYHHTTPTMDILFSQHCVPSKSLNMNSSTLARDLHPTLWLHSCEASLNILQHEWRSSAAEREVSSPKMIILHISD